MKKKVLMLIVSAITASILSMGCAAALVGGGLYKSSETKEQRQTFMTELQKTNTDRETKGLPPLDWCSEAYKFDEGWANNDKECAKRINAYKKGDKTALNLGAATSAAEAKPAATKTTTNK